MNTILKQDNQEITLNDAQELIYNKDLNGKIGWVALILGGVVVGNLAMGKSIKGTEKTLILLGIGGFAYMYGNKSGIRKGLFLSNVK
jgi:hypothetical protein